MIPEPPSRAHEILSHWECGSGRRGAHRAAALAPELGPEETAGARTVALIRRRAALCGPRWPLRARCPDCGADASFEVDAETLAADLERTAPPTATTIDLLGHRRAVRACTLADLEAAAAAPDLEAAVACLLARCVEPAPAALDNDAVETFGQVIEALDPAAAIAFDLACPACGVRWSAPLDVPAALWAEVEGAAGGLLVEIDTLARTYGWSEAAILRLTPLRRAAYLQLAEAS